MTEPVPGIPQAARERLEEVRKSGGSFFTSDLTTNEFLLVREAGFRPLTQVMGSCFYHVGWQGMPYMPGYQTQNLGWAQQGTFGGGSGYGPGYGQSMWRDGQTFELETTSEAWNEARRLALERLSEEAQLAGADAVVGVRLQRGAYDWASGLIEFVAIGTAVASERFDLGEETVLSNLSGQEFAQLFRHGWWPVGLVAGTTVCYALTGWKQRQGLTFFGSRWQNQELTDFTPGPLRRAHPGDDPPAASRRTSSGATAWSASASTRSTTSTRPNDTTQPRHHHARPRHGHRRAALGCRATAGVHRPAPQRGEEMTDDDRATTPRRPPGSRNTASSASSGCVRRAGSSSPATCR